LFVLLRRRRSLREIVRRGDAIGDIERGVVDREFDSAIKARAVVGIPRSILCELAALDGAVVLNNAGSILAYGAILEPRRRKGILQAEGSRTKAAIGASHYGLAIKVSSDGDMTLYVAGKKMIQV
jgi:DNA integrity scanning protein DisA with diadenylate cyclase activity